MAIDPSLISAPAFVAVPGRDRIVPSESALPLARLIQGALLHQPAAGHIGMAAGARAEAALWREPELVIDADRAAVPQAVADAGRVLVRVGRLQRVADQLVQARVAGHAGLFATAGDVAAFVRAWLAPESPVLSAASRAEAVTCQTTGLYERS